MNYEAWRISYQSSEQAARAAYARMQRLAAAQPDPREIGEAIDAAIEMIERLDRLIQQDPVGWFARIDGDGPLMECRHTDIPRVTLYARPGAQPAPESRP